jgi:hypothetical protein
MHKDALKRLREIVTDLVNEIIIADDHTVDVVSCYGAFGPLDQFVKKHFARWAIEEHSWLYSAFCVADIVVANGVNLSKGKLIDSATVKQQKELIDRICAYWESVPFEYEFSFSLSGLKPFRGEIVLWPGIVLRNVVLHAPLDNSLPLGGLFGLGGTDKGVPLNRLLGALETANATPPIASLIVTVPGLMRLNRSNELPALAAIRIVKIILQLGIVDDIFTVVDHPVPPAKAVTVSSSQAAIQTSLMTIPSTFAEGLRRVTLNPSALILSLIDEPSEDNLRVKFKRIIAIIVRDQRVSDGRSNQDEEQADQQGARVATATEWLFDAINEGPSAMSFVQTAIAFEALYGGGKEEPVGKTISTRIAYSLGRSASERENIEKTFVKFYEVRSKVVHAGATRLTGEQRMQLFACQQLLGRGLRHELSLVPAVELEARPKQVGAVPKKKD